MLSFATHFTLSTTAAEAIERSDTTTNINSLSLDNTNLGSYSIDSFAEYFKCLHDMTTLTCGEMRTPGFVVSNTAATSPLFFSRSLNPVQLAANSPAANSLPIKIAANSTPLSHVAYNKLSPTLYTNNYKLPTS